jgi:hypothetical protein
MKEVYGHTVDDLIGTIRADEKIIPAETIARFIKESNGDFTPLQTQEIIGVLKQMSYNEQMKEKQSFKKR